MRPSDLDASRWRRIDEILGKILEAAEPDRPKRLEALCGEDRELRREVEILLDAYGHSIAWFDRAMRTGTGSFPEAIGEATGEAPSGRMLGPFRLMQEIGRGGMGVVYLAEDTRIGRNVALKTLAPWIGLGAHGKRRFLSEARAVSTLDHPNVATLYEADVTEDDQLYLVFAFYRGETLADRIARGPVPPGEAVEIARGIAAGLVAAHAGDVIHRDVKPSNVLLVDGGGVKLLDFGVASIAGEPSARPGTQLGTLAYMSPEQATADPVDARTDLWSLGVVLYEMLTGQRPFGSREPASLIRAIRQDQPARIESICPGLPVDLGAIVERLLRKRPGSRYPSATALLEDLEALQAGREPERTPAAGGGAAARRRLRRTVAAALAGLTGIVAGAWMITARVPGSVGNRSIERIAVLPLENLTGDSSRQVFVDGIQGVLISELGKIRGLDVISRTSVMQYDGLTESLPRIAEGLGVDALLEGSVVSDSDSLIITVALWEGAPERQLWTNSYRRAAAGVYEIAGEVSRSIAGEVGVDPDAADGRHRPSRERVDPEAYEAYVLGRFHLEQRDRAGFEQARRYLLQAIAIDSMFGPAYTALAEAYGSATFFGMFRPSETMPRVRDLADQALRLDSALSDAHRVSAAVALYWDWDLTAAERGVRRALELNPSNVDAYGLLSEVLSVRGRYDEALEAIERGSELDRFVPFAAIRPAVVLLYARDYDRSIQRLREGLEFFPGFWQGHMMLCRALAARGEWSEAVEECEEAARGSGRNPLAIGSLGAAYAGAGDREQAEACIAELSVRRSLGYAGASHVAVIYAALDEPDRAFEWLDVAHDERDVALVHLGENSLYDPLRDDPRFDKLRSRMGLTR